MSLFLPAGRHQVLGEFKVLFTFFKNLRNDKKINQRSKVKNYQAAVAYAEIYQGRVPKLLRR